MRGLGIRGLGFRVQPLASVQALSIGPKAHMNPVKPNFFRAPYFDFLVEVLERWVTWGQGRVQGILRFQRFRQWRLLGVEYRVSTGLWAK